MSKYRKKPVVVEAFQYDGDISIDTNGKTDIPQWIVQAFKDKILCYGTQGHLFVQTLEGTMIVSNNDYIIQGVNGELYPCKPDIFEKTYERID